MATPSPHDGYSSPLSGRYASAQMQEIWSARRKFGIWRKIWLAVAEAQHEMGLPVTLEQVAELRANLDVTDEDLALAEKYEAELRHDVMAHVHAWGDRCPKAKGIIHLGMTSQDINCNTELDLIDDAIQLIVERVERVIVACGDAAERTIKIPTLGFTHFQPAQPTTVGRRLAGWGSDLVLCADRWMTGHPLAHLRGLKGATGTQASFFNLLGSNVRVEELEFRWYHHFYGSLIGESEEARPTTLCSEINPDYSDEPLSEVLRQRLFSLTGQTYPRVVDTFVLADLASVASVLHKIATDIRLLSNRKELDEPFGDKQIGSSAMPYKRNPMMCERICGLARFVWNLVGNAYDTAATQWLERTLDDSANRRLVLPEAFLALDGALVLMERVIRGLDVHEAMIRKNLMAELPFMATENILMEAVKAGADRQVYHEKIRVHAQAAGNRVKNEGAENDLIDRLKGDKAFHTPALKRELDWDQVLDPMKYVGLAVEQTERFLKDVIEPLRERYGDEEIAEADAPRV